MQNGKNNAKLNKDPPSFSPAFGENDGKYISTWNFGIIIEVHMSWETKISRTVRVVNSQEMGTFARLLTAIANAGGNIGGIELLNETFPSSCA